MRCNHVLPRNSVTETEAACTRYKEKEGRPGAGERSEVILSESRLEAVPQAVSHAWARAPVRKTTCSLSIDAASPSKGTESLKPETKRFPQPSREAGGADAPLPGSLPLNVRTPREQIVGRT